MKTRDKILIGGLGALTPIILNLMIVDFDAVFTELTTPTLISYLIRVIVLFYLGGIIAYLHKSESDRIKLLREFQ